MNDNEEKLVAAAQSLGATVDQCIHLSWTIQLPEAMTLEHFVRAMSIVLLKPIDLKAEPAFLREWPKK